MTGHSTVNDRQSRSGFLDPKLVTVAVLIGLWVSSTHAQSGGGYLIRKSTSSGGHSNITGGGYRLSGVVGQHDAADINGNGYRLAGGFWSPAIDTPQGPLPDPTGIDKVRYLSFQIPALAVGDTAIQIELFSLMHPSPPNLVQFPAPSFIAFEGQFRYVGTPGNCTETESPPTTYKCAPVQCTPVYVDWSAALGSSVLHVTGRDIVPSSTYKVRQLAASCAGQESGCGAVSVPLTINMQRWGDIQAPFQATGNVPLTQPNVGDIAACVDKFRALASAPITARADINPAIPNGQVQVPDIASVVDAFKAFAYPFTGASGPQTCP